MEVVARIGLACMEGLVAGDFKQPYDSDDAEELKDISILNMRGNLLEEEIGVKADCCHKVNNIHRIL